MNQRRNRQCAKTYCRFLCEKRKNIKAGDKIKFYKEPKLEESFFTEVVEVF